MRRKKLGEHRSTVQSLEHTKKRKIPSRCYRYIRPWISLSAKWLETAGFRKGDRIRIESCSGRPVITRMAETDTEEA